MFNLRTISIFWAYFTWTLFPASCLYPSKGPVKILSAKTFESTILSSDHLTIVKFMAPWCGHCKNLVPVYKKVATSLEGKVNVAAIDCDEEKNKALCGKYGIQGFPTLKVMRPETTNGKRSFTIEDYNGQRTAKAIVDHVVSIMPSRVKRLESAKFAEFLKQNNQSTKAILFTKKGTISSTFKALSTSFSDNVKFFQVRDNQQDIIETFAINEFPTLLVLPGGERIAQTHSGDMTLEGMSAFINSSLSSADISDGGANTRDDFGSASATGGAINPSSKQLSVTPLETFFDLQSHCIGPDVKQCLIVPEALAPLLEPHKAIKNFNILSLADKLAEYLETELNMPKDRVVFLNGKRSWFIASKETISSKQGLYGWLDDVKQGMAGGKKSIDITSMKDEL